jgi:hypothetical protein
VISDDIGQQLGAGQFGIGIGGKLAFHMIRQFIAAP